MFGEQANRTGILPGHLTGRQIVRTREESLAEAEGFIRKRGIVTLTPSCSFVVALRAAVAAPEREARRWFSWPAPPELVEELVESGRLVWPEAGWLAAP